MPLDISVLRVGIASSEIRDVAYQ